MTSFCLHNLYLIVENDLLLDNILAPYFIIYKYFLGLSLYLLLWQVLQEIEKH